MARTRKEGQAADAYVLALCKANPNLLVPHWLIASFMYYVEDNPILADATFDAIVRDLGDQWDMVEHRHKHLIDRGMLKSGFYLQPEDYPGIVKGAASALRGMASARETCGNKTKRGRKAPVL